MRLTVFKTLSAVLEGGSFAAAARTCHLTPSAISLQMKQLETFLGQPLFDRSGLEVKPLPNAYEIVETMRQAMIQLDELRRHVPMTVAGTLRIGIIETMQSLLLPRLFHNIKQRYPMLRLQIQRGKSMALTDAVKAGDVDAAVVGQPESGGSARLHWFPLLKQPIVLVAPPNEIGTSVADLFQKHEWIRYDRDTITGRMAARYVKQHYIANPAEIELDTVRAIMAMVNAGLGVSVVQLSEPGIKLAFPVNVIELKNSPTVHFSLVMRKSNQDDRLIRALCDVFRSFLPEPSTDVVAPTSDYESNTII